MTGPSKFVQALLDRDFSLAEKLLTNGIDINFRYEPMGWTALHHLVEMRLVESVGWLLERGADPNTRDASGWTPLLHAIDVEGDCGGREIIEKQISVYAADITELLLKHGADPNTCDHSGRTPLRLARRYQHVLAIDLLVKYGATDV